MPGPEFRRMVPGDLDRVTAIEKLTFPDPWSKRSFATMLRQTHIYAIVAEGPAGTLSGYAMCSLVADEGEIQNIAVVEGARGQGLGRGLLAALLRYLKEGGAARVYLEVRRSNEAAIALYRRAGFQPLGVRPSYYAQPREDALTMTLELGSQTAGK